MTSTTDQTDSGIPLPHIPEEVWEMVLSSAIPDQVVRYNGFALQHPVSILQTSRQFNRLGWAILSRRPLKVYLNGTRREDFEECVIRGSDLRSAVEIGEETVDRWCVVPFERFPLIEIHVQPKFDHLQALDCRPQNQPHLTFGAQMKDVHRVASIFSAYLKRRLRGAKVINRVKVSLHLHDTCPFRHPSRMVGPEADSLLPSWSWYDISQILLRFNWIPRLTQSRTNPEAAVHLPHIAWIEDTSQARSISESENLLMCTFRAAWSPSTDLPPLAILLGAQHHHGMGSWLGSRSQVRGRRMLTAPPASGLSLIETPPKPNAEKQSYAVISPFSDELMSLRHSVQSRLVDRRQARWRVKIMKKHYPEVIDLINRLLKAVLHDIGYYTQTPQRLGDNIKIYSAASGVIDLLTKNLDRYNRWQVKSARARRPELVKDVNARLQEVVDLGIIGTEEFMLNTAR